MSPLSQFRDQVMGSPLSIDRRFSPLLNYIDEFDRHFSHHHRFINCFIPRFDLSEDSKNYYLSGDLPGARTEDIWVSARDERTLAVEGTTHRLPMPQQQISPGSEREPDPFVQIGYEEADPARQETGTTYDGNEKTTNDAFLTPDIRAALKPGTSHVQGGDIHQLYDDVDIRDEDLCVPHPLTTSDAAGNAMPVHAPTPEPKLSSRTEKDRWAAEVERHKSDPHHSKHPNENSFAARGEENDLRAQERLAARQQHDAHDAQGHRVIFSERLTGDFHRMFHFPGEIVEGGIKASMLDGVLSLVVPKKEVGEREQRKSRVLIQRGDPAHQGSPWGFATGAV
jgi:HSP20 family molecular chaperone IbpA